MQGGFICVCIGKQTYGSTTAIVNAVLPVRPKVVDSIRACGYQRHVDALRKKNKAMSTISGSALHARLRVHAK